MGVIPDSTIRNEEFCGTEMLLRDELREISMTARQSERIHDFVGKMSHLFHKANNLSKESE